MQALTNQSEKEKIQEMQNRQNARTQSAAQKSNLHIWYMPPAHTGSDYHKKESKIDKKATKDQENHSETINADRDLKKEVTDTLKDQTIPGEGHFWKEHFWKASRTNLLTMGNNYYEY